jgi:integrase
LWAERSAAAASGAGCGVADDAPRTDKGRRVMSAKLERTRTPGIFKRGSRYVFSYRVNGVQRWESCRTLEEARRAKAARQTDIGRGEFEERSRLTLREYATEWIERYHGRGRRGFRDDTRDDYRRQLGQYVFRYFPDRARLTDVTPSGIAGFVGWLCDPSKQDGRELADSTIRNIMAPLRACLATAVREGLIRSNPARDIDLPHRPTVEDDGEDVRALTREQLDVFLRIVHTRHRVFFQLLAATGLRISEAIALEWRHIELDGSSPHVKVRQRIVRGKIGVPKSRHSRRDVPISHTLVRALRSHQQQSEWRDATDPVFPTTTGTVMAPNNLSRRVLKPAAEEAGAPWAGFHTFRHTCATLLFAEGRNAVQVQRWLGHHSPAFTLATYVHLLDGDIGPPLEITFCLTGPPPLDATRMAAPITDMAT